MHELPAPLAPLGAYRQFILYEKGTKTPLNPHTLRPFPRDSGWQDDPSAWTDAATACAISTAWPDVDVGFLLTDHDPFFLLDIDHCWDGQAWSDLSNFLVSAMPGAAVEVSSGLDGLHVIGTGTPPPHGCKNSLLGLELYHRVRYIALTGRYATGSASTDCSATLPWLVSEYFPETVAGAVEDWTYEPVEGYSCPDGDAELIERALGTTGAAGAFGGRVTFADLWQCNAPTLAAQWPSDKGDGFDRSTADASLAQHLAFWTGSNCERILSLMWQSGLVRDKWHRDDYLPRTIMRAVGLQSKWFSVGPKGPEGMGAIKGPSQKQNEYAERVRASIMATATEEQLQALAGKVSPSFWIDNKDRTAEELAAAVAPMESSGGFSFPQGMEPVFRHGYQFLTLELQAEYFAGLVYVNDRNAVWWRKTGQWFKSEQFNNYFGGYEFQLDLERNRKTKKPWDAFVGNQAIMWPRVESTIFKPTEEPGSIVVRDGVPVLNTYLPIETPRRQGDPTPFLDHLARLLPNEGDREILLSYMSACVQYKGHKFQWAPLIQGVEGNGKTLLTRCVEFAIGRRYCHRPRAEDLNAKFNDYLMGKLFIGVEDIYIPDARRDALEVLKPVITNGDGLEIEAKRESKVVTDICANFMFNCNRVDGVHKTRNDRRFAPFFTAQQQEADLARDGMDADYFTGLYGWLRQDDGYAIVHELLETYPIAAEFNPAVEAGGMASRAPLTSSTESAISIGRGAIEQVVLEAVEEGRPGFKGGWVSSIALENLLQEHRKAHLVKPNSRRPMLQELGYEYHPALPEGRSTRCVAIDGGKKPRLYVKRGHLAEQLTNPADVVARYEESQAGSVESDAARAFS